MKASRRSPPARFEPSLLAVREAARQLGVSYSTLKQWIYQGRLRTSQTPGGHHRVPEAEVRRLLAPHRSRSPRAAAGPREARLMSISGRNQIRGIVDEVRIEGLLAQVRLRIGDQALTAVITRDAVEELGLATGQHASAVIKATEVMIAREHDPGSLGTRSPRRSARRRAT